MKRVGEELLYHMLLAEQEYLLFSLWLHKWKASVTAETKPGSSDCLTATVPREVTVYCPWARSRSFITRNGQEYARLLKATAVYKNNKV